MTNSDRYGACGNGSDVGSEAQAARVIDRLVPQPGLRVVVTAGADGLGAGIARAFMEAEARVHVCDIDEAALGRFLEASPGATATRADVATEGDIDKLIAEVEASLGGLDVLINNAGIAGPTASIDDIGCDDWRRTIDVNLTGQFLAARRAVPLLRRGGDGSIVNMSSVAGRLGYAFRTPYVASKAGVVGLTQSLAKELGPEGIRVNAILPGMVRGQRMEQVISARAHALGRNYQDVERELLEKVSLRRMVETEDIAAAVLFLASPGARNVSGQAISICGNVETL